MVDAYVRYKVHANPAIQEVLKGEPEVWDQIKLFLGDMAEPILVVAGPPDPAEHARAKRFGQRIPTPAVTLRLRKFRHHLTGEPCCGIEASDADLAEIMKWNFQRAQKARPAIVN